MEGRGSQTKDSNRSWMASQPLMCRWLRLASRRVAQTRRAVPRVPVRPTRAHGGGAEREDLTLVSGQIQHVRKQQPLGYRRTARKMPATGRVGEASRLETDGAAGRTVAGDVFRLSQLVADGPGACDRRACVNQGRV